MMTMIMTTMITFIHIYKPHAQVVKVVENKVPEKVLCTAEAYPEASFMWRFNDEIIQTQVRYLGLLDYP